MGVGITSDQMPLGLERRNLERSTTNPPAPGERSRAVRRRVGTILCHQLQAVHSKDPQNAHRRVQFGRLRMSSMKPTTEDKNTLKLIEAMIAMSTRTPRDRMKLNRTPSLIWRKLILPILRHYDGFPGLKRCA